MYSYFSNIKWAALLVKYATVIGGVAAIYAIANHYEQVGYDKAVKEIQDSANAKITEATQKAVNESAKKLKEALDKQRKTFDAELERAKNDRQINTEIQEVIKYVDRIEIKNNCKRVGSNVTSLLNKSIRSANKASGDDS